jgi:hypothetical protein
MPTLPSPTDTIIYMLEHVFDKFEAKQDARDAKQLAAIAALLSGQPPATKPPADPSPEKEIAAFRKKYTPDPVAFEAEYHVPFKKSIPPMPLPLNPDEVMKRAGFGYSCDGFYIGGPTCSATEGHTPEQVAASAIDEIARGKIGYWVQVGYDPDVIAVGVMTGLFDSLGYIYDFMGTSQSRTPSYYRNVAFQDFVAGIKSVGQPSGGQK